MLRNAFIVRNYGPRDRGTRPATWVPVMEILEDRVALSQFQVAPVAAPVTSLDRTPLSPVAAPVAAPRIAISGPEVAVRGQRIGFTLRVEEFAVADRVTRFTFQIDWNGDGRIDQQVTGPSGIRVRHLYPTDGNFDIGVAGFNADEPAQRAGTARAFVERRVFIRTVALEVDPSNADRTVLAVGGGVGRDIVAIASVGGTAAVRVAVNGLGLGIFSPSSGLAVFTQAGDDDVQIAPGVQFVAVVHGGAGRDRLGGGFGPDVLLGEDGDDTVAGGPGPDIMIGGRGADILEGNRGEDLLVGGTTRFDANDLALTAIQAEWSCGTPYTQRVANIEGTGKGIGFDSRLNGEVFLRVGGPGATVQNDGAIDRMTGATGRDWYLGGEVADQFIGRSADEVVRGPGSLLEQPSGQGMVSYSRRFQR